MSRTLKFYGASDDLFEIEGTKGSEPDEIPTDFGAVSLTDNAGVHGMIVTCFYGEPSGAPEGMPGCWTVGICPLDEDVPLPEWPMRWKLADSGYSTMLEIDVPDGIIVTELAGGGD